MLRPADPLLQSPSGFVQEHFLFKASYNDRKKLQITYSLKHSQTTAYDRYDRLIQQTNGQPDQAEWRYAPQLWSSHLLHLRYTKKNQLFDAADLRVAYQLFEEGRISRRFGEDERLIRLELVEAFSVNADLVRSLGGWGQLFYGAEWVRNDVSSTARSENINSGVQTPAAADIQPLNGTRRLCSYPGRRPGKSSGPCRGAPDGMSSVCARTFRTTGHSIRFLSNRRAPTIVRSQEMWVWSGIRTKTGT